MKYYNLKKLIVFIWVGFLFLLSSCEDVVKIEVKDGKQQLVVDAWLTNEAKEQKILLTYSQPYFDDTDLMPALGAEVTVILDNSRTLKFSDENSDGVYTFTPQDGDYMGDAKQVRLLVKLGDEQYQSFSALKRVPTIDSVAYEEFSFPVEIPDAGPKDGFLAEFYANDLPGEGDTYLIRSYKNDSLRFKPENITLAYDAGFSAGSKTDGLMFILPIRQSINPVLFQDKDKLKVELLSIPIEAYYYIIQLRQESQNGGIFATPSSNIPTNVFNINSKSENTALGAFIVSRVSSFETVIDKKKAKPKK